MKLCVLCQKGGHNKTTATVNLAAQLARSGRPGVVVDLDSHQLHSMKFAGSIPGVTFQTSLPASVPDDTFVIIDTSPHIVQSTIDALNFCDLVLLPCLPTDKGVDAVKESLVTVGTIHAQRPDLGAMVFFTTVDDLASSKRTMREFRAESVWPVSEHNIRERKHDFRLAYRDKRPVKAESPAGQDYLALANEIEELF